MLLHVRALPAILATLALAALACCGRAPEVPAARAPHLAREVPAHAGARRAGPSPDVVVVLLDALRADAVDADESEAVAMPWLSRLARAGTCFTQASASAPRSLPSLGSVLTGLLPDEHGLTGVDAPRAPLAGVATWARVMAEELGYHTAAVMGDLPSSVSTALSAGFAHVERNVSLAQSQAALDRVALSCPPGKPRFLVVHADAAAAPYGRARAAPPDAALHARAAMETLAADAPVRELVLRRATDALQAALLAAHPVHGRREAEVARYLYDGLVTDPDAGAADRMARELEGAYRAGLAQVDLALEQLVGGLRQRGLLDGALLIVAGTHGESLGEHGMLHHGRALHEEVLRVPLVVQGPAPFDRPRAVHFSVGMRDLFPSVLEWLGAPLPIDLEGRSWLARLAGDAGPGLPVEAQEVRTHHDTGGRSHALACSVRNAHWKYVGTYDLAQGTLVEQAYDLRADPQGLRNLASASDGMVRDLPFDPPFCRAVERARDRLWAGATQAAWSQAQGYSTGRARLLDPRPAAPCDTLPR